MARSVSVSECEKRAHEQFVICKNIQNRDQVARLLTFILILHVHYITLITPTLEPGTLATHYASNPVNVPAT